MAPRRGRTALRRRGGAARSVEKQGGEAADRLAGVARAADVLWDRVGKLPRRRARVLHQLQLPPRLSRARPLAPALASTPSARPPKGGDAADRQRRRCARRGRALRPRWRGPSASTSGPSRFPARPPTPPQTVRQWRRWRRWRWWALGSAGDGVALHVSSVSPAFGKRI